MSGSPQAGRSKGRYLNGRSQFNPQHILQNPLSPVFPLLASGPPYAVMPLLGGELLHTVAHCRDAITGNPSLALLPQSGIPPSCSASHILLTLSMPDLISVLLPPSWHPPTLIFTPEYKPAVITSQGKGDVEQGHVQNHTYPVTQIL